MTSEENDTADAGSMWPSSGTDSNWYISNGSAYVGLQRTTHMAKYLLVRIFHTCCFRTCVLFERCELETTIGAKFFFALKLSSVKKTLFHPDRTPQECGKNVASSYLIYEF